MPIIWVAVESKHHGSRKEAAQIVRQLSSDLPAYTHSLFVPALRTFLSTVCISVHIVLRVSHPRCSWTLNQLVQVKTNLL